MDNLRYYNTYDGIQSFPYKIIRHLFDNEKIWKLIKYDDNEALSPSKANLTLEEKTSLIWSGQLDANYDIDSSKYRVFQQPLTDDTFIERNTQLRVYEYKTIPIDRVKGIVLMRIAIITHSKLNGLIDTQTTRIGELKQEIIKSIVGEQIGGIGDIFYDRTPNTEIGSTLGLNDKKNYFGYVITVGTWVSIEK